MISESRRVRFMGFPIAERLGHLAVELARTSSSIKIRSFDVAETGLEHSRAFIEWTAPDLLPERVDHAARLVEIQLGITFWYHKWKQIENDAQKREQLSEQAQAWSDEILKMSGLLDRE